MEKFIIANRFEIQDLEKDLLGRGGMGVVYRATDNQSGETVAVKTLNSEALSHEPNILERFRREGDSLRQLDHPNIVKFITAVESFGQHYLVMEYVDGGSLQSLLARHGYVSSQRAVEISLDLADALTRAHHLGIIYRDLKPANVLLAQDGTPRLTDFGIAQLADGSRLTQTGILVGTVNYLSPEALSGEVLDFRTDIWAFGVLLFEMLTGKLPFTGNNITARITATLTQPVPDLTQYNLDIPKPLADLIYRMLEKDRQQRIPSMRQVGAELESMLNGWQGLPISSGSRFEAPTLSMQNAKHDLPTGTVTFLFTDIEGSTKLAQQYPDAIRALIARHNEILTQTIESQHGYIFQIIGDSFAVSFHNANDALSAALQAQRDLHRENWNPAPIKVRMGIHTGTAQLQIESKDTPYSGYAALALTQRIMSAGHGGQILISSATENLLRGQLPKDATLRDMGEKNLKDIFLPERIYQLNVPDLPSEFAPLNTYEKIRHNLPLQLTTFIGREKEVEQIKKRLEKNRLVTLTGSGGIGKTRLSIQVASELLSEYPIGMWLVELAPLTDPSLVPQSVCAALGVTPEGGTSALDALINYMHEKKILLVVDNCEHLIDACAQLCDALLHACADLRIIASSREALGIEGENAYRVPSLSLPNPKSGLHVIEESEAVKLFLERATTILPEFEMTEANAPIIAQICQRLDGIALAIELAASRVKMLKVEKIATRLDDAFRLLTGGSRTALPRQQTLRALIDWSYNLLPDEERTVLRKLSIFMGGWTLEAAEAICGNADALDLLTHLVDKSLVSVDFKHGDEPRYYLLETVRQYAREKLVESENMIQLRDVHLDYFLKLAERIAPELYHRKMPYWLDYLEVEYPNLHAALEWAQERDVDAGLRLCNALFRFLESRGDYRKEGLEWFEKFLEASTTSRTAIRAWALYHAAMVSLAIDYSIPKWREWMDESLPLAREIGDHACVARILNEIGNDESSNENFNKARAWFEESLSEARLAKDEFSIGFAIYQLGGMAVEQSENETARSLVEESLAIFRNIGELTGWYWSLTTIGGMCCEQGDWTAAQSYLEEALALTQEAQHRKNTSICLLNLGELFVGMGDFDHGLALLEQCRKLIQDTPDDMILNQVWFNFGEEARLHGNYEEAMTYFEKCLAKAKHDNRKAFASLGLADIERLRNHPTKAKQHLFTALNFLKIWQGRDLWKFAIPILAYFAIGQQKAKQAIILFGWATGWRTLKKIVLPPVYQAEFDRYRNQARVGLSESEFNAAWAEGQSMSEEQVLALAMEVLQ
jgi:predicted ATPase/serine/threonine protein kinase/Tfp pilus assembly protein PilF